MIDVVFLLLIFFVCTASFQIIEHVLPTHLSAPGSSVDTPLPPEIEELERIVVAVYVDRGHVAWTINERSYDKLADVRAVLAAVASVSLDLPVVLDASGEVAIGDVIDVYDICRAAGFARIQFAASTEV